MVAELQPTAVVITDLPGKASTQWIEGYRTIRYSEIRVAQVVRNSRIYLARVTSPHRVPFGVRLHLGKSQPHPILFTADYEALMDALESHHVPVDRSPRRLGFMLMGRR